MAASPVDIAPSATTMMLKLLPCRARSRTFCATSSMSYGISGIKMTSAPPATPASRANHPARCPITSTTMIRLWLVAVECSRSMASVAIPTAVLKPKLTSVLAMSLSMVLGRVTMFSPAFLSRSAFFCVPPPPRHTRASRWWRR